MKTFIRLLSACLALATAHAAPLSTVFVVTTQTVSIPAGGYTVSFGIYWFGDDYPQSSAPGRIELRDAGGNLLGRVTASHYQTTGVSAYASLGYLTDVTSSVNIYAADGSPADGQLNAQWHITGVPPGTYTLRFFEYTTWANWLQATRVWTETTFLDGWTAGSPPTITWSSAPTSAASGAAYTVSAQGHDADGNLTQINVWKNGQPFAFAGGGNGTDGDSGNSTSDTGPQTITFTAQAVDGDGATSPVITHTVTINGPVNIPPTVTLVAPGGQTVTAGTALTITSHATDPDGNITAHNLDIQRPAGDWNYQGGFATGAPYQGGPVGSGADSTRTASFTFTDTGTYQVRSAANDGSGWVQSATVAITVIAPPPVQYSLVTSAGTGGTVSPGGTYNAGTVVTVSATPDSTHDFAGWSGDAMGTGNPSSLILDRNKSVQANFALKLFALTTSATTGGNVTPGGSYPYGTSVTVSAAPDATHRFIGWAGDASGSAPSILVTMTSPRNVQAIFTTKTAQTITFASPGNQLVGSPAFTLGASASSGLSVTYAVLSGPATVVGSQLQVTGPGAISVQASQPGDATFLPAANIIQTFSAAVPPPVQYALVTSAGSGGTVSPGGTYNTGTVVTITATPDSTHDFAGWSGDAAGTSNPLSLTLDRNKSVQASFTPKLYALTTSATAGGNVTPGGSYPYGTSVTVSAAPDATHRFISWAGDASGSAPSILVTLTGSRNVQAVFTSKTAQTIVFASPGNQPVGAPAFTLGGSASSGLPVTYVILSGPATITGNQLQLTGPGSVTVQVSQPGDATYLPAANVIQTFNAVAAAFLKYRPTSRTLFQTNATTGTTPFVLEKP
jgi:hypothetical protein